jgi:hypothetical protein
MAWYSSKAHARSIAFCLHIKETNDPVYQHKKEESFCREAMQVAIF